jgi:transcriptional regulator with XRE-family HTH domain
MMPASEICVGGLAATVAAAYRPRMADDLATKIRKYRQSLGLNQAEFGDLFGVTQGSVSRWEKGSMPDPSALIALAARMGVDLRQLIGADFEANGRTGPLLFVKGDVAAGVWREDVQWDEGEWQPFTGGDHFSAPKDARYGLRVEGESMNMVYPPGTILDCVSTIGTGAVPLHGQRVIVVRQRTDGAYESTVKEYVRDGDKEWLVPRSYNPAFQTPIEIGTIEDGIAETTIMAIVKGSYRPE